MTITWSLLGKRFLQIGLIFVSLWAISSHPNTVLSAHSAYTGDAETYAKDYQVSLDEAIYRLNIQEEIGILEQDLQTKNSAVFAGIWIQHQPKYSIILHLVADPNQRIATYLKAHKLYALIDIQFVKRSYNDLVATQAQIQALSKVLKQPIASSITIKENIVEVYTENKSLLISQIQTKNNNLPVDIVIKEQSLPVAQTQWYAGNSLPGCTTSFSIKNNATGVRYIMTAGHCQDSSISPPFNPLPVASGGNLVLSYSFQNGSGYDYKVLTKPQASDTITNLVRDNAPPFYNHSITGYRFMTPTIGTYLCKYGKTTGYTCGTITSTTFSLNGTTPASYIEVLRSNTSSALSCYGDSGSPWYAGQIAYGVHTAGNNVPCGINSSLGYFMPIAKIFDHGYSPLLVP
ncbi:S1 family peptidase [Herpetosiphon sp. NSE202]|uniref:S1 family peptidase n=1 Tax=Herpetosiphon sp. NSE202 TaxID=3351349 RepID=UPI003642BEEC